LKDISLLAADGAKLPIIMKGGNFIKQTLKA
jgi:hypothetical protein